MAQGRKRTPDHLKVVKGSFRKCASNEKQPDLPEGFPETPLWMVEEAQERFDAGLELLETMGVLTEVDGDIVALIAQREHEMMILNEIIKEQGHTYAKLNKKGEIDLWKGNPAVTMRNETMRHLQSLYSECGLTPAARSKVSVVKKNESKKNPFSMRK
jgi:P27 family predicted phage terminase small subunit